MMIDDLSSDDSCSSITDASNFSDIDAKILNEGNRNNQ